MIGLSRLITKKTLVAAYSSLLDPVYHPDEWDVPESVRSVVVNLSIWRKQVGRPQTTRIPSIGEKGRRRQQVCPNYRQVRHNRVNGTNIDPETRASTSAARPSNELRHRRPRVCSVCGQLRHSWTKCNLYNVDKKVNNKFEWINKL